MRLVWVILSYIGTALFTLGNADKYANVEKSSGKALGIMIMGSIANTDPDKTVVLIKEVEAGSVKAVKKGFKILKKYKVMEATAKYLVVQKEDGALHLVYQSQFSKEFIPSSAPANSQSKDLDFYAEDGFERRGGNIKLTASYREKIVKTDLSKILMQASAIPNYSSNGQINGFKLLQIDEGSIYANSGFKDDDIITSINGTPLNNISSTIKLLHGLKNEDRIDLEYLRNGETRSTAIEVN